MFPKCQILQQLGKTAALRSLTALGFMGLRVDRGLCNHATGEKTGKSAKLEIRGFHMTTAPHGIF